MPKVRIEIFEGGAPSATISVPAWLVTGASNLLPGLAGGRLRDSVEIGQIAQLLKAPNAAGQVLEVEDHAANERIVISIIGDDDATLTAGSASWSCRERRPPIVDRRPLQLVQWAAADGSHALVLTSCCWSRPTS
jgi:hypothetical protein